MIERRPQTPVRSFPCNHIPGDENICDVCAAWGFKPINNESDALYWECVGIAEWRVNDSTS
jgi:hypothetical protein